MQGYIRRLLHPPVSAQAEFAALDARKAAETVAEHTGHDEFLLADDIADALSSGARGLQLTSAERLLVARAIVDHRKS